MHVCLNLLPFLKHFQFNIFLKLLHILSNVIDQENALRVHVPRMTFQSAVTPSCTDSTPPRSAPRSHILSLEIKQPVREWCQVHRFPYCLTASKPSRIFNQVDAATLCDKSSDGVSRVCLCPITTIIFRANPSMHPHHSSHVVSIIRAYAMAAARRIATSSV
jgi:hypothetical protein